MVGTEAGGSGAVAIMGGTFDPVHHGHLRTALELSQQLGFAEVRLVPCRDPVHRRRPGADAGQRLAMLRLAVADEPGLVVDDREVRRSEPSYTVTTLESLREELGATRSLVLVMGVDAFLGLPSWHRWKELPELAHILVVQRPGWPLEAAPDFQAWLEKYRVEQVEALHRKPNGHILLHRFTPLAISATQIRALVAGAVSPRYLIPDGVWNYIRRHRLYTSQGD